MAQSFMNEVLSCNCLVNINGAFLLTLRQYVTMQQ
ncbi:pilus assembly protein PilW [Escherichia coli]|nr:pilus assembly protein PilW [Escherichia coli]